MFQFEFHLKLTFAFLSLYDVVRSQKTCSFLFFVSCLLLQTWDLILWKSYAFFATEFRKHLQSSSRKICFDIGGKSGVLRVIYDVGWSSTRPDQSASQMPVFGEALLKLEELNKIGCNFFSSNLRINPCKRIITIGTSEAFQHCAISSEQWFSTWARDRRGIVNHFLRVRE